MANRKRNHQIIIRLSDEEYQTFLEQVSKSKLSKTNFLIKCITRKKIIVIDGLNESLTDLKRVGDNMNQISITLDWVIVQNADKELKEIKQEFVKVNDLMLALSHYQRGKSNGSY